MKKCIYTSNGNYNCKYQNIENFDNISNITNELVSNLSSVKNECEESVDKASLKIANVLKNIKNECSKNSNFISNNIDISKKNKYIKDSELAINYMININNTDNDITQTQKNNIKIIF